MKDTYTAVVKKSDDWWIGWIEEVPEVNCQESSRDELIETLTTGLITGLRTTRGSCSGSSKHAKACAPAEASNWET